MTHTPAPWKMIADPYDDGTPYFRFEAGDPDKGEDEGFRFTAIMKPLDASLILASPEMFDLITEFGGAITDMFEQMIRGNWKDDHDHDVGRNQQMIALKPLIIKAINLRAAIAKATA